MNVAGEAPNYPDPGLTAREREVVRTWLCCRSKREAGAELFIAAATVCTHIERARTKYAAVGRPAHTKALLLARALEDGIVRLGELDPGSRDG